MTYVEKINAVLQKLIYSAVPCQLNSGGYAEEYVLKMTREDIAIVYNCCLQMMNMSDPNAKPQQSVHITIIDGDKK